MGRMTYGEPIDTERGCRALLRRTASSLRGVFGDYNVADYRKVEHHDSEPGR